MIEVKQSAKAKKKEIRTISKLMETMMTLLWLKIGMELSKESLLVVNSGLFTLNETPFFYWEQFLHSCSVCFFFLLQDVETNYSLNF